MFGKGGISNLLKQTQQMQEKMKKAQEELAHTEVTGESGAGAVKVTLTCQHACKRVVIEEEQLLEDKEMLEDLVAAAINDATKKVENTTQQLMGNLTSGLSLPAGMESLFK
ncbi:MAG: YbaB/EbfC family nucleoid-associated protein [Neisseriaceae bacterium]